MRHPGTLEDPTEGRLDSGSVNPPVVRSDSGAPLVPSDAGGASVAENDSGSSSAQLDDAGTAGSLADSGHVAASPNDSGSLGSLGTDAGTACAPCALGFTLNTADCSCTDTNECAANNGGCDQICVDSSFDAADDVALFFACSCEAGFALSSDGFSCAATDAGGSWADSGPAATQDGGTPGEANADAGQAIALNDGGGGGCADASNFAFDAALLRRMRELPLADASVSTVDSGGGSPTGPGVNALSDFNLTDTNPYSDTLGQSFSPRQYLGRVTAWYFGSGG